MELKASERKAPDGYVKKKTEATLKAAGIVLAMNAAVFALRFIFQWVGLKPGIDYRATKGGPEVFYVQQLVFLILAFMYYRHKVKAERNK